MSNPQIEYRLPKLRQFQPLLPKHFKVEDTDSQRLGEGKNRDAPLASSRSAPGFQTQRDKASAVPPKIPMPEDMNGKLTSLQLQKTRLYQELYQMEEQHSKKDSIQARMLSIQAHIRKLQLMSEKAEEMMSRETLLLERYQQQLEGQHSQIKRFRVDSEASIHPGAHSGRLICTDVSGVLAVLEFTDKVTAHLNVSKQRCSTVVPLRLKDLSIAEIWRQVIPRLSLRNVVDGVELVYSEHYPPESVSIAARLSGYPHSLVCLSLVEKEDEVTVRTRGARVDLTLNVPIAKLSMCGNLQNLNSLTRLRLQQILQANLLVQQRGGVYSLMYKSYTYHLGRLVYRVLPMHGELFSITVHPERTQFQDSAHEKAVCTAHVQVLEDEAVVSLVVDVLSGSLRLYFKWKRQEVCFREEVDTELFHFLKNLQFVSPRECPVTFLKSLEMLKSISHGKARTALAYNA